VFTLNGAALKLGVLEDIGDDVDSLWDVLMEALGVVDRLLMQSVRIEVSAEILHLDLEGMLGATASALEGHMLEEVGQTI
jgi:RNAse (barnase) inhibitor barstar